MDPTINIMPEDIRKLPCIAPDETTIEERVVQNIALSRADWDAFETSWDFQRHPLVGRFDTVRAAFEAWERECEDRFQTLKANEEELNRIFIDIYGLGDELTSDVAERDVTVRRADRSRDIRSLISYAVGCMLGRYSPDRPGLAFAGGDWQEWLSRQGKLSFRPSKHGILPITDDEYFADDIVRLFEEWLKLAYGEATLEENLRYIADTLGGKGMARDCIRAYFLNGFYQDHLRIYQKRPIYWLFDSGRRNGFKALVYMHRWRADTVARVRVDYVHETQSRYRTAIEALEKQSRTAGAAEKVRLTKRLNALEAQAAELRKYEEKIHHLADSMIGIDPDDGVKVNYAKFADVLAPIK